MKILMVCLGNICRSPLAEGILKSKAKNLEVDSAGTAGYHIGKQPDFRSIDIAKKYDIDLTSQRARQFSTRDFDDFDKIYVMDNDNYSKIISLARSQEDIWLICQLVRMAHDQYINGRWSIKIRHEDLKLIQGIEAHLHANSKLDIRKHIHPLTQVLLDIYYGPNTDTGKTPHKYSY